MRYINLSILVFAIGGCALPVPIQFASWATSGLSYATTGKSMSDHAVSAVTLQDCAMHRVMLGEKICSPIEIDGVAVPAPDSQARDAHNAGPSQAICVPSYSSPHKAARAPGQALWRKYGAVCGDDAGAMAESW
jgi:hypothetical protein